MLPLPCIADDNKMCDVSIWILVDFRGGDDDGFFIDKPRSAYEAAAVVAAFE